MEKIDEVNVAQLCNKIVAEYEPKAEEKGLTLNAMTDLPADCVMTTNRNGLDQILRQLLDNAVKYTDKGGITVSASNNTPDKLTLTVSDTGPGIPVENSETVFEPFYDTGGQVKTTGMGLSICRTICNLLEGNIRVDNSYKRGCRMVVNLPYKAVEG